MAENLGVIAGREVRLEALRLAQSMDNRGPSLKKALLRLAQALSAKETKFFQYQGRVMDQRDVVAHSVRLQAVNVALQFWDAMPSEKHEITGAEGGPIVLKWPENGNSPT